MLAWSSGTSQSRSNRSVSADALPGLEHRGDLAVVGGVVLDVLAVGDVDAGLLGEQVE
jgi:hypothetical protein